MKKPAKASALACPCGGGDYSACCGRFLAAVQAGTPGTDATSGSLPKPLSHRLPETALELMRSRYTAYALSDVNYLLASWHPTTRPAAQALTQEFQRGPKQDAPRWLGLEIRRHLPAGDTALVEFVARYKLAGRAHRLHEVSNFVREDGRWLYVEGTFPSAA